MPGATLGARNDAVTTANRGTKGEPPEQEPLSRRDAEQTGAFLARKEGNDIPGKSYKVKPPDVKMNLASCSDRGKTRLTRD